MGVTKRWHQVSKSKVPRLTVDQNKDGSAHRCCAERKLVDLVGIEPTTSSMPWKRAPSCATGPQSKAGQLLILAYPHPFVNALRRVVERDFVLTAGAQVASICKGTFISAASYPSLNTGGVV